MKVLSFKQSTEYLGWWLLEIEGQASPLLVGSNWVSANGILHEGDEILFDATKYLHYSDAKYHFLLNLRMVPKETVIQE